MTTGSPSSESADLSRRLLDAFPAGTYGLPALLRVLELAASRDVASASIECRVLPVLRVNPDFVQAHAATPEKLVTLVLHELHHLLLGHTRLYPRLTPVQNLVFDAVINAMLSRLLVEPACLALFTDFYAEDRFPECFLRPPPGWDPSQNPAGLPSALGAAESRRGRRARLAEAYRALYSPEGIAYDDLREVLEEATQAAAARAVPLLGDHRPEREGASSAGHLEGRAPVLLDAVRQAVESWPRPADPVAGRSHHDLVERLRVHPRPPSNRERLGRLLRRVASARGVGRVRGVQPTPVPILSALPARDRRAAVLASLGAPPVLHRSEVLGRRPTRSGERVHVYVDVSGSVAGLVPALFGAVRDCWRLVHPTVHVFSTEVVDLSIAQVAQGVCETTGGTHVECVARHMRDHGVRRAVWVTDGYVGTPSATARDYLRGCRVGVALTPGASTRADIGDLAWAWTELGTEGPA